MGGKKRVDSPKSEVSFLQPASPGRSRSISSRAISSHSSSSGSFPAAEEEDDGGVVVEEGGGGGTLRPPRREDPFCCCCCWRCLKVPEGLEWAEWAASSSSSSSGMVHELTMEAERRLARLELPELELELTEETVLIVEIGDMVEVRPLRELSPLSLLL